jgi:biotin operon repressor
MTSELIETVIDELRKCGYTITPPKQEKRSK